MCSSYYYRFTWLIILLLVANSCFAAAAPKYNGRMNNAVNKVIQTKLHKQYPFAANDPRFNSTVSAVSSGVITLALNLVSSASWPVLLLKVGINALAGFAVPLALDKGIEWIFKDNGKIENTVEQNIPSGDVNIKDIPEKSILDNPSINQIMYLLGNNHVQRYIAKSVINEKHWIIDKNNIAHFGNNKLGSFWKVVELDRKKHYVFLEDPSFNIKVNRVTGSVSIPSPMVISNSVAGAIDDIPEELLDKKLSPGMLAVATNAVWRAAAAGGHSGGISWSADDPVTEQDVQEWLDTYPEEAPTVGDFIAPVAPPAAAAFSLTANNSNPLPSTSTANAPETAVNPEAGQAQNPEPNPDPQPDPDPEVGEPELEDIPTAEMILAPLLNLMSDLKNFSVPSHVTVCPVSSFTALGKEYQLRTHCDLIEQHRALIDSAMVLAWAITALFIVLKA